LLIRHYRVGWLYPSLAQNQIAALQRCDLIFAVLKNWIRQPRIDKDYVPGRRRDFEGRLAIPGELRFHANHKIEKIPLGKRDRENHKGSE
jgi:hypothetical protein